MSIGKSKAKIYVETDTGVTFDDVAGVDEAKDELQEIVEFPEESATVRPPRRARCRKACCWSGRPEPARRCSPGPSPGEAERAVLLHHRLRVRGDVRRRRRRARARPVRAGATKAPAIIFIDELDALGRARGVRPLWRPRREGADAQPASGRDGRFRRAQRPRHPCRHQSARRYSTRRCCAPAVSTARCWWTGRTSAGASQILKVHLRKAKLAPDVDPEKIAALTPGFTGADLANLVNEAALLATRRGADAVTLDDFTDAVERIVAGLEKRNRLLNPKEREIVAYHEMGHAAGRGVASRHRSGAQGLDHSARRRCARLHHPAADRGSLPDDARGTGKQDVGAARRPRRRIDGVRALSTGAADDLAASPTSRVRWSRATACPNGSAASPTSATRATS